MSLSFNQFCLLVKLSRFVYYVNQYFTSQKKRQKNEIHKVAMIKGKKEQGKFGSRFFQHCLHFFWILRNRVASKMQVQLFFPHFHVYFLCFAWKYKQRMWEIKKCCEFDTHFFLMLPILWENRVHSTTSPLVIRKLFHAPKCGITCAFAREMPSFEKFSPLKLELLLFDNSLWPTNTIALIYCNGFELCELHFNCNGRIYLVATLFNAHQPSPIKINWFSFEIH